MLSAAWAREKPQPAPQWAVDATKTPTPDSAKNSAAVVLFDEYLITVDGQNHAVEREREAIRILKEQPKDKPLFLYVPFNAVHAPFQTPDSYRGPYKQLPMAPDTPLEQLLNALKGNTIASAELVGTYEAPSTQ